MFVAAAATVTVTGLATWWVALPPVGMLGGYLMLLREAARADAELRHARVAAARASQARLRERPHRAAHAATGGGSASGPAHTGVTSGTHVTAVAPAGAGDSGAGRIVSISERLDDDIYDQYTDAKLRAVGD